ncbi:MAG: hypothetical protein RLZZ210_1340 [Pseudomonadota bacterium]|jgi:hypothetical protein
MLDGLAKYEEHVREEMYRAGGRPKKRYIFDGVTYNSKAEVDAALTKHNNNFLGVTSSKPAQIANPDTIEFMTPADVQTALVMEKLKVEEQGVLEGLDENLLDKVYEGVLDPSKDKKQRVNSDLISYNKHFQDNKPYADERQELFDELIKSDGIPNHFINDLMSSAKCEVTGTLYNQEQIGDTSGSMNSEVDARLTDYYDKLDYFSKDLMQKWNTLIKFEKDVKTKSGSSLELFLRGLSGHLHENDKMTYISASPEQKKEIIRQSLNVKLTRGDEFQINTRETLRYLPLLDNVNLNANFLNSKFNFSIAQIQTDIVRRAGTLGSYKLAYQEFLQDTYKKLDKVQFGGGTPMNGLLSSVLDRNIRAGTPAHITISQDGDADDSIGLAARFRINDIFGIKEQKETSLVETYGRRYAEYATQCGQAALDNIVLFISRNYPNFHISQDRNGNLSIPKHLLEGLQQHWTKYPITIRICTDDPTNVATLNLLDNLAIDRNGNLYPSTEDALKKGVTKQNLLNVHINAVDSKPDERKQFFDVHGGIIDFSNGLYQLMATSGSIKPSVDTIDEVHFKIKKDLATFYGVPEDWISDEQFDIYSKSAVMAQELSQLRDILTAKHQKSSYGAKAVLGEDEEFPHILDLTSTKMRTLPDAIKKDVAKILKQYGFLVPHLVREPTDYDARYPIPSNHLFKSDVTQIRKKMQASMSIHQSMANMSIGNTSNSIDYSGNGFGGIPSTPSFGNGLYGQTMTSPHRVNSSRKPAANNSLSNALNDALSGDSSAIKSLGGSFRTKIGRLK